MRLFRSTDRTLRSTRKQWERLGRTDPLWAILTDPARHGGGWDPDAFFRTGEEEIAFVLGHLTELGVRQRRDRALDFGCGVGRLTRALAGRFERCDGVDIAESMVKEATRINRDVPGCVFHLNVREDLQLFQDDTFAFVYSALVLQHMPRPAAERFIREFFRVAAPGGAVVFQVPTATPPRGDTPPDARRTAATAPLPQAAFRARVTTAQRSLSLLPRESTLLTVTIENASQHALPSLGPADAHLQVQVASRWLGANGRPVDSSEEARTGLPYDLGAGAVVSVDHRISAPPAPGEYALEVDLVQEDFAWFGEQGSQPARIPCTVRGHAGPGHARQAPRARPFAEGFRSRHPRAHRLLTIAGVVRAYRVLGPGVRRLTARLRRRWPKLRPMDTNFIPTEDVAALVRASGGRLLEVERDTSPDGIVSCRYWCTNERPA